MTDQKDPSARLHRLEHRGDVVAERGGRQIAGRGGAAPAVGAEVEQHAAVPLGQLRPLVMPGGEVEAEAVDEDDDGFRGVPGRAHGDLGAVEGTHHPEVLGRQRRERPVVLRVVAAAARVQHGAADHAAGDGSGRDPGGDDRLASSRHPTYSRGTRALIAVAISYPIVPMCEASSSAVIRSSPEAPIKTTSSPVATSSSPQSTRI